MHVAIIMDGNGRWAQRRGLPRTLGHKAGVEAVRRAVESARKCGISYLTLFGFSSENWQRPADEINELMGLLRLYLQAETASLHKNGIRLRVIGDRHRLADDIIAMIEQAERLTEQNDGMMLVVALSYGGRAELVRAAQILAQQALAGQLDVAQIDELAVGNALFTAGLPDPDLLIRTSGEQRISNFLLWQCAYAELVFLDVLWPDFSESDLIQAIEMYHQRERRFGASSHGA